MRNLCIILLLLLQSLVRVHAFATLRSFSVRATTDRIQGSYLPSIPSQATSLKASSSSDAISSNATDMVLSSTASDFSAEDETSPQNTPSYRQLLIFTFTTILIWLSEPLLSLVDTTIVGWTQKSSVIQLASLGPATTLLDSCLYLSYFLAIATTNLTTKQLSTRQYRKLQETTSLVLGVASLVGLGITLFVSVGGAPLLQSMAGASATPALVQYATQYSIIRASVSVASVVGMVAQSTCLACLDTATPALAVLAASVVNVVGDILLRRHGVVGAAVATASATCVSTAILLRSVRRKFVAWRRMEVEAAEQTNQTPSPAVPLLSLPTKNSIGELLKLAGPIFLVILAKVACYGAMTIRITDFGVLPLAAHNILMRIFFFFACFGDAISQTAQSFLPSTLYPTIREVPLRKLLTKLVVVSAGIGLFNTVASIGLLETAGPWLTRDAQIIRLLQVHAPYMGCALLLHPFIMLLEGTVLGAREFPTLVSTYAVTVALHFALLSVSGSFADVWRTLGLFQAIRLVNFGGRLWWRQQKKQKRELAFETSY